MKCIFLYNPKSGKGKILPKVDYIKKTLETKFDEVVLHETKSAEDVKEVSRKACGVYDAIVFSGGDGTFNDVACGVASEENRPILGYIPSGTVNDIAKNLKIPRNVNKALQIIMDGYTIEHDVGKINDKYFIYVAAIGTFTGVSYRTKQDVKKIFGKLAYAFDGMRDLLNPKLCAIKLKMEHGVIEIDTPLLLIMNSTSVAGVPFNKGGHLNDGKFDIVVVKKGAYKGLFNIARLFVLGLFRLRRRRLVNHYKASSFTVEVKDTPTWTIDGEKGPEGNVMIENMHNHIEIYIPVDRNKRSKSKSFN